MLARFHWLSVLQTLSFDYLATVLLIIGVGLVFYFIPNAKTRFRDVWVGAVLTGVLWRIAFDGFAWYIARNKSMTMIHGSIAAVVVFLLWVYLSSIILMYGVEFTAAYARLRRRRPDDMPAALPRVKAHEHRRGHEDLRAHKATGLSVFVLVLVFVAVPVFAAITLISVKDEIAIGRQANADIRKQTPELTDREVRDYVRSIGATAREGRAGSAISVFLLSRQLPRAECVCAPWRTGLDQPRRAAGGDQRIAGGRRAGARNRAHRPASCRRPDDEGHFRESRAWRAWRAAGQQRRRGRSADGCRPWHQSLVSEVQPGR